MDFLITESQFNYLVENKDTDIIEKNISELESFSKKIYSDAKRKFGIDLKLLLTWGTAVGGLVAPLDNFIKTSDLSVTDDQASLILIGIITTLFFDNEELFSKVYTKIKEEGIEKQFMTVLRKGQDLKKSFINFLLSLNISINNISGLIRYSFLIPIISDLQNYVSDVSDVTETAKMISARILASGAVLVSSDILYQLIRRILRKLS
ncbi:MAG: hypothetical protein ACK5P0_00450 [bacterium]|jgi:hypothetical protein